MGRTKSNELSKLLTILSIATAFTVASGYPHMGGTITAYRLDSEKEDAEFESTCIGAMLVNLRIPTLSTLSVCACGTSKIAFRHSCEAES